MDLIGIATMDRRKCSRKFVPGSSPPPQVRTIGSSHNSIIKRFQTSRFHMQKHLNDENTHPCKTSLPGLSPGQISGGDSKFQIDQPSRLFMFAGIIILNDSITRGFKASPCYNLRSYFCATVMTPGACTAWLLNSLSRSTILRVALYPLMETVDRKSFFPYLLKAS